MGIEHILLSAAKNMLQQPAPNWMSDLHARAWVDGTLVLEPSFPFEAEKVQFTMIPLLEQLLYQATGCVIPVSICSMDEDENETPPNYDQYTFDRFEVDDSNKFACAAARAVHPYIRSYNPVLFYSATGQPCGKTHLMFSVANTWLAEQPAARLLYRRGSPLYHEIVECMAEERILDIYQSLSQADLIMLDDIHVFIGHDEMQRLLANVVVELCNEGKEVMIAASCPLQDIAALDSSICRDLIDNYMVADIGMLGRSAIIKLLNRKIDAWNLYLDDEAMQVISDHVTNWPVHIDCICRALRILQQLHNRSGDAEMALKAIQLAN